jgi:hypothetical protein
MGEFMNKRPIGAYATVVWLDDKGVPEDGTEYSEVYFSFGEYNEDNQPDCDSFGVSDDRIFYYVDDEIDLERMKNAKSDFKVIDYELEYQDEQI